MFRTGLSFNQKRRLRNIAFRNVRKLMLLKAEDLRFWDMNTAYVHARILAHWGSEMLEDLEKIGAEEDENK